MARRGSRGDGRIRGVNASMTNKLIGEIDDPAERDLVFKAIQRANDQSLSFAGYLDWSPSRATRFARGASDSFRRAHKLQNEITRLDDKEIAFGSLPDQAREEFSRFSQLMYDGFQERFLNRHPAEEPKDFIERARKMCFNWTKIIVNVKSLLYIKSPIREFVPSSQYQSKDEGSEELEDKEDTQQYEEHVSGADAERQLADFDATMVASPEAQLAARKLNKRFKLVWDAMFNATMLFVDRMTRLVGVVSVRPFFDPKRPGKIRPWVFLSHQLRIIPHTTQPWRPAAVIERMDPFDPKSDTIIWTDKSFIRMAGNRVVHISEHSMGRIPHTFFKDNLNFQSFFVEGEGRSLCVLNSVINDKITDLNEIIQFQGYSQQQVINPADDQPVMGPRRTLIFRPQDRNTPYGIEYANPKAPIGELSKDIERNIADMLRVHRVPETVIGIELGRRIVSGVAIRALYAPIIEDNNVRQTPFVEFEEDLAENIIAVLNEFDNDFKAPYVEVVERDQDGQEHTVQRLPVKLEVNYIEPEFPIDQRTQTEQEQFDVQQGITTPPDIMRKRRPHVFSDRRAAIKAWEENIKIIESGGRPTPEVVGSNKSEFVPPPLDQEANSAVEDLQSQVDSMTQTQESDGVIAELVEKMVADAVRDAAND